jgi:KamA family protein
MRLSLPIRARPQQYYTLRTIERHPRWKEIPAGNRSAITTIGRVFPFRVNSYVLDELIDWSAVPDDPIFRLVFPQQGMLSPANYRKVADAVARHDPGTLNRVVRAIRMGLNPHPAGQLELNVPVLNGSRLPGIQHKYAETVLFFPAAGQTCHAYCTFCFRWPQFAGMSEYRFASHETDDLVAYLASHPEVTDVLVTGGDPLVMPTKTLRRYLEPLLRPAMCTLRTIRLGSKALSYWPARFVTDDDADDLLRFFEQIVASGRNLAFMAHLDHAVELSTPIVREAIRRIRSTGAIIRTQAPVVRHINDSAAAWRDLWTESVALGMIPYYMFIERDTGAHDYFSVPIVRAWRIYREALSTVSGLGRTVRGPSMSTTAGKIEVLGPDSVGEEPTLALRFLQGRNPDWTYRLFHARYDEAATWIDELKPAGGAKRFFFEEELAAMSQRDAVPT